jgi:hypothetical protein
LFPNCGIVVVYLIDLCRPVVTLGSSAPVFDRRGIFSVSYLSATDAIVVMGSLLNGAAKP